jgi:uncharacterized OB-fold protein
MIRRSAIQIPFRYAAGKVASRFLRELRDEGRILGAPCATCGRVSCPARSSCPACGQTTSGLVEVGPGATLLGVTEVPGSGTFGLVRLDGADNGMLHRLLGDRRWTAGDRLRARISGQRCASILDIEGFEKEEPT